MKDEKYRMLEQKYKKKCEKVMQLNKKMEKMKCDLAWAQDRDKYAWKRSRKLNRLEDALPKKYYKVFYKCKTKGGTIREFNETVVSCHPIMACEEIKEKDYADFEFITIEQLTKD